MVTAPTAPESGRDAMDEIPSAFWATLGEDLLSKLNSSAQGLTTEEAEARLP